MSGEETIASRFVKLNHLILGKSSYDFPNRYLAHRDGLLDVLFAVYEECNVDYMRKDKHIATFVDKFKGVMVELKSLRVNVKDFEVKKVIGRGHFGEVQVVREKSTGDVYAMKILRKEETLLQQNVAFYKEERDIMSISTSPWLTKLQYAFQDSLNLYLVMEFHPGGDMLSLLEKYDNVLTEDYCQFYLAELVLAINSLHSMGYVHRDIKPDNILIDRTGHIKLADFGSASKLNPHKQVMSSMPVGTPDYVAPEVLTAMNPGPVSSRSYGIECDWWSLGIVTYEMVFGSTPFSNEKVLATYNNIMNFKNSLKFPAEASDISKTLIDLIKGLLSEASTRLDYDQLIDHPFFADINWNDIRNIPPPYVPTVSSVDDTSNFDDFEAENRPYVRDLNNRREFTGKNLPFVGFTFTSPIETKGERLSSVDETGLFSPSSSFCEPSSSSASKKREMAALQNKISELLTNHDSLKNENNKLKMNSQSKEEELSKIKNDKIHLEKLVKELTDEVQLIKQLLAYEREHRVITEKKAAQLTRCMKTKQKQEALRLRSKSREFDNCENKKSQDLEDRLEEALSKIDEFLQERAELLEDLEATKHTLLDCQKKYKMDISTTVASSESANNSRNEALNNSQSFTTIENSGLQVQDFRRLVFKLEKKNIELEKDIEKAMLEKKVFEASNLELQNTVSQLEMKIADVIMQNSKKEIQSTIVLSPSLRERSVTDSRENTFTEGTSGFSEDLLAENLEQVLQNIDEVSETNVDDSTVKEKSLPCLTMVPLQGIDIPCETAESVADSVLAERKVHQSIRNGYGSGSSEHSLDSKEEIESLKSRIEALTTEIMKLKEDIKDKEASCVSIQNQLKEKEAALAETKIDLRISVRKEKEAENLTSCLRERNKELREKVKSLEETQNEKTRTENELKEKIIKLESELSEKLQEVTEKQKLFEASIDVTQKFAKSQDHYEEVVKQNMDLIRETEEKSQTNSHLLEEIKHLKKELTQKKNECVKFEKLNNTLKSLCKNLDEDLDDFQIITEAKEKAIRELLEQQASLKSELKSLEEALKSSKSGMEKAQRESKELVSHVNALTAEMESNNTFHETEMQDVRDQLAYYKKIASEMEEQNVILQKELNLQNSNSKGYSEKIMRFESELCEIKEEAARHITQISSLKSSNLKLTQALENAIDDNKGAHKYNEELLSELESIRANNVHEKVKLQETIAQQTKLIDFLQSKTENMEKRKKPHLSRLFGKKENSSNQMPLQYRDVEKLLETEKSRCRRLQDQLSQARAEVVALQREITNVKSATLNVEVPQSPLSRAMHCVITQSPSAEPDSQSPVLVSRELVNKFSKPPGMKHKIPHRFVNIMCMRSAMCCACLDSLHFGRTIAKCQECSLICHPTCAQSLPSTCGLPSGFMQHFKTALKSCSDTDTAEDCESIITEGWIKVPKYKSNKLGWDRKYLRLIDSKLCLFENAEEADPNRALSSFDFSPKVARIVVTSAVSATELKFAATSDLPYVLKLEYIPRTTCWPKRCLYIMTQSFSDKQMWVSSLEALAEQNDTEVDSCQINKLMKKAVWTLKGDRVIEPLCAYILDDAIILLGAVDGLYILKIVNKFTCSLKSKIDSLQYVYQIDCVESIGLVIFIQGNERRLTSTYLSSMQSAVHKIGNSSLNSKPLCDINDCHLFSVNDTHCSGMPYLCVATSNLLKLFQWDSVLKTFCNKWVFKTKEPCSCIHYTPNSMIFGTDSFYEVDLKSFNDKNFLDDQDASLAGLIYGASQYRSYPIAIFRVSSCDEPNEYLMCFHEMGVFVNGNGQRTRSDDMKWSRLPLSFAYQYPYLFVTHFNSLEVIEILPPQVAESGLRAVTLIENPQYLGPAPVEQSIYLSSCHDQVIELILVDGKSIGRSEFQYPRAESGSLQSGSSSGESEGLEFSFSTSIEQSLAEISEDQVSMSSKSSSESQS